MIFFCSWEIDSFFFDAKKHRQIAVKNICKERKMVELVGKYFFIIQLILNIFHYGFEYYFGIIEFDYKYNLFFIILILYLKNVIQFVFFYYRFIKYKDLNNRIILKKTITVMNCNIIASIIGCELFSNTIIPYFLPIILVFLYIYNANEFSDRDPQNPSFSANHILGEIIFHILFATLIEYCFSKYVGIVEYSICSNIICIDHILPLWIPFRYFNAWPIYILGF